MPTSIAERALAEIARRCSHVRKADSYQTDAGASVHRAARTLSALPAIVVWDNGEQIQNGSGNSDAYDVTLSVSVEVHVAASQACTGRELEAAKADAKRAILAGSKGVLGDDAGKIGTIAYLGSIANPREDGASSESIALNFAVRFREAYGNPYSDQLEKGR